MNYIFTCKLCSQTGLETYRRTSATIPQMCITTIANLQRKTEKEGSPRYFFSKDKEIIPFMESYWESITTLARKQTNTWHATIHKTLQTHPNLFLCQETSSDIMYGLNDTDLTNIKPQYDSSKVGSQKEEGKHQST
jgi:Set1/Ash2 histone methyltransferase complex subunit ASH2